MPGKSYVNTLAWHHNKTHRSEKQTIWIEPCKMDVSNLKDRSNPIHDSWFLSQG
jgi:hypothetical protein